MQKADGGAIVLGTKRPKGAGNRGTCSSPASGHKEAEERACKEHEGTPSPHLGHHPAGETGGPMSAGKDTEMLEEQKADGVASVLGTKRPKSADNRGSNSSGSPATGQKAAEARTGKELEGLCSPHLGYEPANECTGS